MGRKSRIKTQHNTFKHPFFFLFKIVAVLYRNLLKIWNLDLAKATFSIGFGIIALAFAQLPLKLPAQEPTPPAYSFEAPPSAESPLQVELLPEDDSIQSGHPFWIALRVKMGEHWHSYWKNPGDAGFPLKVEWTLPEGFTAGQTEWPYPKRFKQNDSIGFGFEGEVYLLTRILPPASVPSDKAIAIRANVEWLACSESSCLPGEDVLEVHLPISIDPPRKNPRYAGDFSKARSMLPKKAWQMHALRQDHRVELHLAPPPSLANSFKTAYFCPESKEAIDSREEAGLKPKDGKPGEYVLTLKEPENSSARILKGILVLHNGQAAAPHPYEALDVDIPLESAADGEIASADPVNKGQVLSAAPAPAKGGDIEQEIREQPMIEDEFAFKGGIGLAILFAFVGGMILNLMPCVLPVMSFKVLGFVKMAGQSRSATFKHGLAFSAGVLLSFWILAGLMLGLQAYGSAVGWGFQLQEPIFVAALAAILLVFGLSLFGVFEFGTSLTSLAGQAQSSGGRYSEGMVSSFLSGVLATAVATPCTGPFLGSAIGFAVTLPPIWALLIFTFLAAGMAFPYLLLAAFPQWLRFVPKPGPWMITFKELMGFLMLATVVWLVWVFSAETGSFATFLLLAGFLILAIGSWIYGRWCTPVKSKTTRLVSGFLTTACLGLACAAILTASGTSSDPGTSASSSTSNSGWINYSAAEVANLHKDGVPILIDFTASWCLICQANHLVLSTPEVTKKLDELGVVRMKADWTKRDPGIAEALRRFGRNSVPLYLLYGRNPQDAPQVLPQVLTPEIVIQYLDRMQHAKPI